MFQRLKKVLSQGKAPGTEAATANVAVAWINTNLDGEATVGGSHSGANAQSSQINTGWREGPGVQGTLRDKPWKLERAPRSRDYISGEEVRGRADIAVDPQVSIIIMNRPLKDLLEKRAYALYTDSVETEASPTLMEEMRWLALYPEAGWESLPDSFWYRYAVMTSHRVQAMSWLTPELVNLLMTWPEPSPGADVPFILMVMRGKAHLRMQLTPADANTLDHITQVFTTAAHSALDVFSDYSGEPAESLKK